MASLPVEDGCLILPLFQTVRGRDLIDKEVDDFWIANSFELLNMRDVVIVGEVFKFFEASNESIDGQASLFQMRHFMTGSCILVSLTESFQEKASERGVSREHEQAVHVVVIRDLVNDMVGPRASGSSSHIREGKNDFLLCRWELWTSCFEV